MDVLLARLRRQLLLFLLLLPLWIQAVAQTAVTRDTNGMRCGDTLKMQRVEYADAGVSGRGVTWDFSRLGVTDGSYVVPIFCHEGNAVQAECGFLFKYNTSGDTLSIACIENALQRTSYSRPILSLVYPFSFGNSVTADFCGIGRYCDMYALSEHGVAESEADAYGTLVLSGRDTLYNVLRVHEHRQSAIALSKDDADADTMCMERVEDVYSWYAHDFRYPVFKTVSYRYSSSGSIVSSGNYSLRFLPESQRGSFCESGSDAAVRHCGDNGAVPIRCKLNVVGDALNVDYTCGYDADVVFTITDVMGVVYSRKSARGAAGVSSVVGFSLCGLRHGQYVLHIGVGGKEMSEKFTYK